MKIAVVCASGRVGRLLVEEAILRGHEVTAIVRNPSKAPQATKVIVKDLFDLTLPDVKDCEVVIDAFGTWTPDTLFQHSTSLKHLCDILSGKPNRLLVVGGAGSLYVNPEHTIRLMDTEDFPDAFKPVASSMAKALDELRNRNDVRWTYVSPAADFRVDGPRTGKYILGGEELILNSKGESVISYADYAIAMIDEAEKDNHIDQRISVVGEYD
ncbi:MAG TPA: NAD(P)-dependent oxidoreductase [Candidatus Atribacteria bacterium]|mgnify:CR=1 FL=1|nr:NAD(P)-dependent oxidoreductase [Candidatus Atribacteria bacterium]